MLELIETVETQTRKLLELKEQRQCVSSTCHQTSNAWNHTPLFMEDQHLMDLKCRYLLFLIWLAVLFLITCKQKKIPNTQSVYFLIFFKDLLLCSIRSKGEKDDWSVVGSGTSMLLYPSSH